MKKRCLPMHYGRELYIPVRLGTIGLSATDMTAAQHRHLSHHDKVMPKDVCMVA